MTYRVLITGSIHPSGVHALEQESDLHVDNRPDLPAAEILKIIENYHAIITRSETDITPELLDNGKNLKVVARAAVGIGNIDVEYATEKGILVLNTPGKNTNSAAELTLALLLGATRKMVQAHKRMEDQGWDRHQFTGSELLGKTLGIVGLGNVGHRVAKFAKGFDMQVLAYDPYIADEVFERHGVTKASWETLLQECDIISVHTPKNKETTGMIAEAEIEQMKDGVVLVNAARGGIIEEAAMLKALESGKVASAGIDTWDQEPPQDNAFRSLPQVVMTPHIGASTTEAQIRIAQSIANQVPRALRGEVVDYPVNMPQIQVHTGPMVKQYSVLAQKLGQFASQFMDFFPNQLQLCYRGSLAKKDTTLIRLSFLKAFLENKYEQVTYVNAEKQAELIGLSIEESQDPGFRDYDSALKCTLSHGTQECKVGGVIFDEQHPRITLLNDFVFEIEPKGTILATSNKDVPGMIGSIGGTLGTHEVNINKFELSRNRQGGEAMALIAVDDDISENTLTELQQTPNITLVKKIRI